MNHSNITTAVLLLLYAATAQARDTDNNGFIDSLMAEMSIEEKIGQLNLPVGGDVVSGTAQGSRARLSYHARKNWRLLQCQRS